MGGLAEAILAADVHRVVAEGLLILEAWTPAQRARYRRGKTGGGGGAGPKVTVGTDIAGAMIQSAFDAKARVDFVKELTSGLPGPTAARSRAIIALTTALHGAGGLSGTVTALRKAVAGFPAGPKRFEAAMKILRRARPTRITVTAMK